MADLREITQRYATYVKPDAWTEFSSTYKEATGSEPPAEVKEQWARKQGGVPEKPVAENFKTQTILLSDGRTIGAQQDTKSGRWLDLNGQTIPQELLAGAKIPDKPKTPMPGTPGWFNTLPPDRQKTFLEDKRRLAIASEPYGAENAQTNRLRLGVSQEALEIAKERLLYGTETGNVTRLAKSASSLEEEAQTAEARAASPTPIGDTGIVMSWIKSQIAGAGRMINIELEQALSSGSLNQQISNKLGRRFNGTLDDSFRTQMVRDIRQSANVAKQLATTALGQLPARCGREPYARCGIGEEASKGPGRQNVHRQDS